MVKNFLKNGQNLLNRPQYSILSAASVIMATTAISRILGLLRDRLLAGSFFGPGYSWQLDAYFAAFRLPDMIFQLLVVGALSAAFIPVFTSYLSKDKAKAFALSSAIISLSLVAFLILAFFVYFFSLPLSRLIAPSFSPEELSLMSSITRVLIMAQGLFVVSSFITGILQSHLHFLVPALAPVAYNLGIIFGIIFLTPLIGIYGPTIGVVIGALLHLLVQIPLVKRLGFKFYFKPHLSHPGVKRIGRLMLPRTLALAVSQIELTVAVFIATALPAGSLAIFYFAQHLNALPVGLFGATIGQAALPTLSQHNSQKLSQFKNTFIDSFNQILFLSLPSSMMLLILRLPIVRLAFGAKNFPWTATLLTGKVVAFFAISVFAQSVIQLLVRGFYALSDTKTPFFIGVFSVFLNVALSFYLVFNKNLSVLGLALAISIASFFQSFLLLVFLYKKVNGFPSQKLVTPFIKMSLATILTGLALWGPMRFLDLHVFNTAKTIQLITLTLIALFSGLLVYLSTSKLLKIKQLTSFVYLLKKFKNIKKIFFHQPIETTDQPQP